MPDIPGEIQQSYVIWAGGTEPGRIKSSPPTLINQEIELGRNACFSAGEVFDDPDLSRRHFIVSAIGKRFEIRDLQSTNGTYVEAIPISGPHYARTGAVVLAGRQAFVLRRMSEAALQAVHCDLQAPFLETPTRNPRAALGYARLRALALNADPLLLVGAVGTGKSAAALAVHKRSGRAGPFIEYDARELDESGHLLANLMDQSANGTLYLRHLYDAPDATVPSLLRLVRDGTFCRPGRATVRKASARVVASVLGRPLREMGELRSAFGDRRVRLPAVIHRREDLVWMIRSALRGFPAWSLSAAAWSAIWTYSWPGNISEVVRTFQNIQLKSGGQPVLQIPVTALPEQMQPWRGRERTAFPAEDDNQATPVVLPPLAGLASGFDDPMTCDRLQHLLMERHGLSERQAEVTILLARGNTSKEIENALGISRGTVGKHLNRACEGVGGAGKKALATLVFETLMRLANRR